MAFPGNRWHWQAVPAVSPVFAAQGNHAFIKRLPRLGGATAAIRYPVGRQNGLVNVKHRLVLAALCSGCASWSLIARVGSEGAELTGDFRRSSPSISARALMDRGPLAGELSRA